MTGRVASGGGGAGCAASAPADPSGGGDYGAAEARLELEEQAAVGQAIDDPEGVKGRASRLISSPPRPDNDGCMPRARGVTVKQVVLLVVLLAGITCAVIWRSYLSVHQIQAFVIGLGRWGPVVFLLLYAIGPAFLVPGLPFDLAAGILIGPL